MTTTRPERIPCASSLPTRHHVSGASQTAPSRLRHRLSGVVVIAVAALVVPHPAAALMPLPPPPVRFPIVDVARTILTLAEDYAETPPTDKRQLHNEMLLMLNTSRAAI